MDLILRVRSLCRNTQDRSLSENSSGIMNCSSQDLRSEYSPVGTLPNEVLELIRRSGFTGPTGPLIGRILLSLDLAFQELLVRGDPRSRCSSHIKIPGASGSRHLWKCSLWLRMVEAFVGGREISLVDHLLDGGIASEGLW